MASAWADISSLQDLFKNSDAIYLLTDMCKSRRISTMMDRALGKMLINSTLVLYG